MSDEARINTTENGPFMVSGNVPLVTKRIVKSDEGEPYTWKAGDPIEHKARYALCRCGKSDNKPFCDGTHSSIEWDPSDNLPEGTYADRAENLGGDGMTIYDDRPICVHAGFCGNEVTNLWDMADKTGDIRVRSEAIAMIERCPSGALAYAVDGDMVEPSLAMEIGVVPGGPLWVTGGVPVTSASDQELETRNRMTLCRCGASGSKPLCDGSHTEIDFE